MRQCQRTVLVEIAVLLIGVLQCALADVTPDKPRAAVPGAMERTRTARSIRELYRSEYARRDIDSRRALADKLFGQAARGDDIVARYVLLDESRELAASSGDSTGAFRAIDAMRASFEVDAMELKSAALATAVRAAVTPADAKATAELANVLTEDAIAAGRAEVAEKAASQAEIAARAAKDLTLLNAAHARSESARAALRESQKVKTAMEKLRQHPDDPEANLHVGKYLCFTRGDWENGLAALVSGADKSLAASAKQDLEKPDSAEAQLVVADAWLALADQPKYGARSAMARRAGFWYRLAIPHLAGLKKVGAQKHLWAAGRLADGLQTTLLKLCADPDLLLVPMSDATCPDVVTISQKQMEVRFTGEKTFDVASIAGKTRGHIGKAIFISGREAGGSLRAEIPFAINNTMYRLILADQTGGFHLANLPLQKGVTYAWCIFEHDDTVTLEVSADEKTVASISLPSRDFKSYAFGCTLRAPNNKADMVVIFE